jgi:co-chaperonin GroES (HSP10)
VSTRVERFAANYFTAQARFRPLRDQIIVKVLDLKLSDTLIANWSGSAVRGEIIAVGPGKHPSVYQSGSRDGKPYKTVHDSTRFRPTEVKVGQIVHLGGMENGGYAFPKIYIDHVEHVIASERDICGVET